MKHAILILAHKDMEYLCRLVSTFAHDSFRLYIHVDKRCRISEELMARIREAADVRCLCQKYNANWGSYGIVRATLYLCRIATADADNAYFHLISGADVRTCTNEDFCTFFDKNQGKNFLEHFDFFSTPHIEKRRNRLIYEHHLEKYDIRGCKDDNETYQKDLKNQIELHKVRQLPDIPIHHGSQWWSLEQSCVRYVVEHETIIESLFKLAAIPDEVFVQTIVMNSPFVPSVVNCNHRYIRWEYRNGSSPAVLDRSDLPAIIEGHYLFARKIELPVSEEFITSVFNIFNVPGNMDITTMSLDDIIKYLNKNFLDSCHNGLYYGNAGILLFCVCGDEMVKVKDGQLWRMVSDLLPFVEKELKETCDESYKTGRLGIAACLECLYAKVGSLLSQGTLSVLDDVHLKIMNRMCNFEREDMSMEELSIFRTYLSSCIKGGRHKVVDQTLWDNVFEDKYLELRKRNFLWNKSVGLIGFAGRGLSLLTEYHGLPYDRWQSLIL